MNIKFYVAVLGLVTSTIVWSQPSQVLNVMKDGKRFTILKTKNLVEGDRVTVTNTEGEKERAHVIECRKTSCLLELTQEGFEVSPGMTVIPEAKKRRYAVAGSLDNALGLTYGAAFYYNFPRSPWMVGLKFRQIDNKTNDIELSGQILSVEVQRYLWSRSRFQLWGTSEVGMMKIKMDFSDINPVEDELNETEYFVTLGIEGRYNLTENLRAILGVGMLYNTLNSSYESNNNSYDLEVSTFYGMAKVGLIYFF